jgi:hypothetical protein
VLGVLLLDSGTGARHASAAQLDLGSACGCDARRRGCDVLLGKRRGALRHD